MERRNSFCLTVSSATYQTDPFGNLPLNNLSIGSFVTFIPQCCFTSSYEVAVRSLSYDNSFLTFNNLTAEVGLNGRWNKVDLPNTCLYSANCLFRTLNNCFDEAGYEGIFNFHRHRNDESLAELTIADDQDAQLRLPGRLLDILGMPSFQEISEKTTIAFHPTMLDYHLRHMFLVCDDLVESSYINSQPIALLCAFPHDNLFSQGRSVISFPKLQYFPVRMTTVHRLTFSFLQAIDVQPVSWAPESGPIVIQLHFKKPSVLFA
jgi:hypothetical protein